MNLLIRRAGKLSEGTTVDPLLGPAAISEQIDRTGVPHAVAMAGLGYVLPDRRVTSEQVEAGAPGDTDSFRLPRGIIVRGSGVETRRWRAPGQQASDLAAEAGVRALRSASLEAGQIDLLLFGSASQDVAEPATANIVQERLGCVRAACFDVKNACCSFLNALDVAHAAIETGRAERVLVTAGEVLSPIAAARIRDLRQLERRFAALTLGDAGGAVVLTRRRENGSGTVHRGSFVSDGRHWQASVIADGGSRGWSSQPVLECDGSALHQLARRYLPQVVTGALANARWRLRDVDVLVPHQVSLAIVQDLSRVLGFRPDQVLTTLAQTGNTAAASIPVALGFAWDEGRCGAGTKALLVAGAGGFAAGAIAVEL